MQRSGGIGPCPPGSCPCQPLTFDHASPLAPRFVADSQQRAAHRGLGRFRWAGSGLNPPQCPSQGAVPAIVITNAHRAKSSKLTRPGFVE